MANEVVGFVGDLKPTIVMVLVQFIIALVNIFYKLAFNDGMSVRILIAYRFIFATACVVPLALIVEGKNRPKLTWTIVFQGTLCGLFGCSLSQNLMIESIALTSATFATAMANLIPALTFILTLLFRLESLQIRKLSGIAKVVGTVVSIFGAMVLILYKGMEINIWSTNINLIQNNTNHIQPSHGRLSNQILGSLLAIAGCLSVAVWYIVQAKMVKRYPCKYSSTALMCTAAAIQATIYALFTETDPSKWKLGWDIRLLSVVYTGAVATGLMVVVMAWCVRMKGPLFVSIFNPLSLVFVALAGSLILNEKLHMGSVIGSAFIIIGLYAVIWGKGREMKTKTERALDLEFKSCSSGAFEITETDNMTQSGDDDQVITCSSVFVVHNDKGIEDRTSFEASIVAENPKYLEVRFNCSISLDRGAMIS